MAVLLPTPRGFVPVILATSALLYRLSWPLVNAQGDPREHPNALYSLVTKFIFVFSGLCCFVFLFPAIKNSPKLTGLSRRGCADELMYYSAAVICMLITTLNYKNLFFWVLKAINQYFTRGRFLDDPSPFNRAATLICATVFGIALWLTFALQCSRVIAYWRLALQRLRMRAAEEKLGQPNESFSRTTPEKPAHLKAAVMTS